MARREYEILFDFAVCWVNVSLGVVDFWRNAIYRKIFDSKRVIRVIRGLFWDLTWWYFFIIGVIRECVICSALRWIYFWRSSCVCNGVAWLLYSFWSARRLSWFEKLWNDLNMARIFMWCFFYRRFLVNILCNDGYFRIWKSSIEVSVYILFGAEKLFINIFVFFGDMLGIGFLEGVIKLWVRWRRYI